MFILVMKNCDFKLVWFCLWVLIWLVLVVVIKLIGFCLDVIMFINYNVGIIW